MSKESKALILIHLDDDPFEIEKVAQELAKHSGESELHLYSAQSVEDFDDLLARQPNPDVILLDVDLGAGEQGDRVAARLRKKLAHAVILMRSGYGDFETVKRCLSSGADDFISKEMARGELHLRLMQSYSMARLKRGNPALAVTNFQGCDRRRTETLVGSTMQQIDTRIPRVISSALAAIHIFGESGTGKEVVADLFAAHLPPTVPFIKINCGAIAPSLLESELFGHVKGAFTGATADKKGLIESADGGWIFMDEVATLSSSAQIALLRVLENQEIRPVGSSKSRDINIRVLSATNESLESKVKAGTFRGDLWQRLRETEFRLPPLRERPEEIDGLVQHFCRTMKGGPFKISGPAMEVLCSYHWRGGNIRELRNCLRAMTEFQVDRLLTPLAIPERLWADLEEKPEIADTASDHALNSIPGGSTGQLTLTWEKHEPLSYDFLADKLLLGLTTKFIAEKGKTSLRTLAKQIGMSRSTLSTRLKGLAAKDLVSLDDLSAMVGIGE